MGGFLNTNFQAFVHRGNTKNFRENTKEAFQDAKNLGFQYLETDLRETKLVTLLSMKAEDRVCIGSFNSKNLDEVHQLNPKILTSMGIRDIVSLKFFKIVNRNSKVIQIPETWKGLKVLSKKFLNKCKSLGLKVHIWTINDEENMQRLIDFGVDGIMTDKPEVLKKILLKNSISL